MGAGALVDHVVIVIAQPQFHRCKPGPVLHTEKGRDALSFVIALVKKYDPAGPSQAY